MELSLSNSIFIISLLITVYLIGLGFALRLNTTNKNIRIVRSLYIFPAELFIKSIHYYQHFILNFIIVIWIPFVFLFSLLKILIISNFIPLSSDFIFFISFSIVSILSLSKTFGNKVLKIIGIQKIYRRANLNLEYNENTTKFLMYLIYFVFLSFTYIYRLYDNSYFVPEYVMESFLVYLAFDKVLTNKHLCKISKGD